MGAFNYWIFSLADASEFNHFVEYEGNIIYTDCFLNQFELCIPMSAYVFVFHANSRELWLPFSENRTSVYEHASERIWGTAVT